MSSAMFPPSSRYVMWAILAVVCAFVCSGTAKTALSSGVVSRSMGIRSWWRVQRLIQDGDTAQRPPHVLSEEPCTGQSSIQHHTTPRIVSGLVVGRLLPVAYRLEGGSSQVLIHAHAHNGPYAQKINTSPHPPLTVCTERAPLCHRSRTAWSFSTTARGSLGITSTSNTPEQLPR